MTQSPQYIIFNKIIIRYYYIKNGKKKTNFIPQSHKNTYNPNYISGIANLIKTRDNLKHNTP